MEHLLEYVAKYGLSILLIACCIIAFIGILKICKVFSKISNADVKKCIYYALNIGLAFGASAIYFVIFKIPFTGYVTYSVALVGVTTTLYSVYEHFGLRKLVRLLGSCICKWFKSNPGSKIGKILKKLGLSDEAILHIQAATNAELDKAKSESEKTTNQ